jgi:hypothetical protein
MQTETILLSSQSGLTETISNFMILTVVVLETELQLK